MTVSATIIADSMSASGIRLVTMELVYPRFIHDEVMTHRVFTRNAASSRAIPIERMIRMVEENPAMPVRWGLNGKGMQDHGEMSEFGQKIAHEDWLNARDAAVAQARVMLSRPEPAHKQIVNRILAPFMHMTTLVTSTEWANFFTLRYHEDADPTFEALATKMLEAFEDGTPTLREPGDWHLPYVTERDIEEVIMLVFDEQESSGHPEITEAEMEARVTTLCCRISAARCARVSYLNHDKSVPTIKDDLATFSRLIERTPMHASPIEHQATPDHMIDEGKWAKPNLHGNFVGWCQYRKMFVGENATTMPKLKRALEPALG